MAELTRQDVIKLVAATIVDDIRNPCIYLLCQTHFFCIHGKILHAYAYEWHKDSGQRLFTPMG